MATLCVVVVLPVLRNIHFHLDWILRLLKTGVGVSGCGKGLKQFMQLISHVELVLWSGREGPYAWNTGGSGGLQSR